MVAGSGCRCLLTLRCSLSLRRLPSMKTRLIHPLFNILSDWLVWLEVVVVVLVRLDFAASPSVRRLDFAPWLLSSLSTMSGPSADEDVLDPQLAGSILPRLQRIVALLQQAAEDGSSLATKSQAGQDKTADATATTGADQGVGAASSSSAGPSIALGAVSEDDYSLYDFLFASSSSRGDSSSTSTPTELSLSLLREARELRDVYRRAERACQGMQGANWALEEQRVAIDELEAIKEEEM